MHFSSIFQIKWGFSRKYAIIFTGSEAIALNTFRPLGFTLFSSGNLAMNPSYHLLVSGLSLLLNPKSKAHSEARFITCYLVYP